MYAFVKTHQKRSTSNLRILPHVNFILKIPQIINECWTQINRCMFKCLRVMSAILKLLENKMTWWKVKAAQSCWTLCNRIDYIVHGILQARILEWVPFTFSRGSFQPRDRTQVSRIAGGFFTSWATRKARAKDRWWLMWKKQYSKMLITECGWWVWVLTVWFFSTFSICLKIFTIKW